MRPDNGTLWKGTKGSALLERRPREEFALWTCNCPWRLVEGNRARTPRGWASST